MVNAESGGEKVLLHLSTPDSMLSKTSQLLSLIQVRFTNLSGFGHRCWWLALLEDRHDQQAYGGGLNRREEE